MLAVLLHTRRGLSRVAALRAYAWCSLTTGRVLTRAGCNKRSIRKKGAAVEAVLRVSRLAPLAAYLVSIEKWWGLELFVFRAPPLKVVVAVSYSPTTYRLQYHRRCRA